MFHVCFYFLLGCNVVTSHNLIVAEQGEFEKNE